MHKLAEVAVEFCAAAEGLAVAPFLLRCFDAVVVTDLEAAVPFGVIILEGEGFNWREICTTVVFFFSQRLV